MSDVRTWWRSRSIGMGVSLSERRTCPNSSTLIWEKYFGSVMGTPVERGDEKVLGGLILRQELLSVCNNKNVTSQRTVAIFHNRLKIHNLLWSHAVNPPLPRDSHCSKTTCAFLRKSPVIIKDTATTHRELFHMRHNWFISGVIHANYKWCTGTCRVTSNFPAVVIQIKGTNTIIGNNKTTQNRGTIIYIFFLERLS